MTNNIFAEAKVYEDGWKLVDERPFSEEELSIINGGIVVKSNYGSSAKLNRNGGGVFYIPMSRDSSLTIGDTINLKEVKIQTLVKDDKEINRIK